LSKIMLNSLNAIEHFYELYHFSLEALQTSPFVIHQGGLWEQEQTTLKMPLWLEEMQQMIGVCNIGFLTPTSYRAPWNSYAIGQTLGPMNASAEAEGPAHWGLPLRWLKERKPLSIKDLEKPKPYFTFQAEPALLDSVGITYYRAWLSDKRQVLCQHELEDDQWWLYAFFD